MIQIVFFFFFFSSRRRHTRWPRDWSSDVCSFRSDVMRLMLVRHSAEHGFGTADIERAVGDVCMCSVKSFFDSYVRGAGTIDFNRYLALIGLRSVVTRQLAARDGVPLPDLRIRAWNAPPDSALSLLMGDPTNAW